MSSCLLERRGPEATDRTKLVSRLRTHLSTYRDPQCGNSNLMGLSASHQWGLVVLTLKKGSSSCGGKQACTVPGKPPDPYSRLEGTGLITSSRPLWAGHNRSHREMPLLTLWVKFSEGPISSSTYNYMAVSIQAGKERQVYPLTKPVSLVGSFTSCEKGTLPYLA